MSNGGSGAGGTSTGAAGFLDRVRESLADLAEVKVVTVVGNLPVTITSSGKTTETTFGETAVNGSAIVTVVKLLDGDVTTVIADPLVGNGEVRTLHAEQVAASLDVIPTHLNTLVALAKSLVNS